MVEPGELDLFKIMYNFKTYFRTSWVEVMEAFNEITKLVEATHFLFHFIRYVGDL